MEQVQRCFYLLSFFPPAKIISLRNDIMNFKQLDHEHVAQAWERMKLMIRNCPTHGLNLWMIIQIFYAGRILLLEIF